MKKLLLLPLALASCTMTQPNTQPKYVEPIYSPKRVRDDFKDITTISYKLNFTNPEEIRKRSSLECESSQYKNITTLRQYTNSKPSSFIYFEYDWKYPYYGKVYDFFTDKAELIFIFDGKAQKGISTSQINEESNTFGSCRMYQSSKTFIMHTLGIYFNVNSLDIEAFKNADNVEYAIYTSDGKFISETLSKKARVLLYGTWKEAEY